MERTNGAVRHERGSTIVELLVALLLFGIGAASLAGGMRTAGASTAHGRAFSHAAYLAETRLERLRSQCIPLPGAAVMGPVAERWGTGAAAGPLLASTEVEDSVTITLATGARGRVVASVVRCVP